MKAHGLEGGGVEEVDVLLDEQAREVLDDASLVCENRGS